MLGLVIIDVQNAIVAGCGTPEESRSRVSRSSGFVQRRFELGDQRGIEGVIEQILVPVDSGGRDVGKSLEIKIPQPSIANDPRSCFERRLSDGDATRPRSRQQSVTETRPERAIQPPA